PSSRSSRPLAARAPPSPASAAERDQVPSTRRTRRRRSTQPRRAAPCCSSAPRRSSRTRFRSDVLRPGACRPPPPKVGYRSETNEDRREVRSRAVSDPAVTEDLALLSLADGRFTRVELAHELRRPRLVPFRLRASRWELQLERPPVDRLEYLLELQHRDG